MPITGGSFELPGGLKGRVMNYGAADWMVMGQDGPRLDVRMTLKREDGVFIYLRYEGHAGADGLKNAAFFETNAPEGHPARALTNRLIVMVGGGGSNGLEYDLYALVPAAAAPKL